MSVLRKLLSFFDVILNLSAAFSGVLVIFLMLTVTSEVLARYFLKITWMGMLEINEFGLLYLTFLSAAWVLKLDGHVAIEAVVIKLKTRARIMANAISSLAASILCFFIFWHGTRLVWGYIDTGRMFVNGMTIPAAIIIIVIPAGFLMLSIQFLRKACGCLVTFRTSAGSREKG